MVVLMFDAYRLAAVGTRKQISDGIRSSSGSAKALLEAVLAQYDGDVDLAISIMSHQLKTATGIERAAIADMLAPIFVMRQDMKRVRSLAYEIDAAGWSAPALAFLALVAADAGNLQSAKEHSAEALHALEAEPDIVVRFRVLQRLALAAYYLHHYAEAVDLGMSSASLATRVGAWRVAAAGYSIAYNIHHDVTDDVNEADRFARLWHSAAEKTGDESFVYAAVVAEYELAVQFADRHRIDTLETEIRTKLLPQQYTESYVFAISCAMVRGSFDLKGMRTLLLVLKDTPARSRGEWALCASLAAVASAAIYEDDIARRHIRDAIARLGRSLRTDRAYERYYRRMTRACLAAACILLGDHVRADRIVAVQEARTSDEMGNIPSLIRSEDWDAFPKRLRGLSRIFALAVQKRRAEALPAGLTPTEFEILRLLGTGWSAGKIARATDRSVNTIYSHTRSILGKFEASRASEAVAIARGRGLLP